MDLEQPAVVVPSGQQAQETARARKSVLAPWLAWSACALSVAFVAAALVLAYLNDPRQFEDDLAFNSLGMLVLFAYTTVGAIIASRRAHNPVGWLFLAAALLIALGVFAEEYTRYALVTSPGSLPGGNLAAALRRWPQDIGFPLMFTLVFLFFPDGRLLSRRWRAAALLAGGVILLDLVIDVIDAIKPGLVNAIQDLWGILLLVIGAVCAASVLVRFRRAQGDERQQMKWFAYAAALPVAQFGVRAAAGLLSLNISQTALDILLLLSIAPFPIATGIAILKYRLYDIDLIINRTLVYVPLTGILAGVFAASIALFQKLFQAITGAQSDAAVVLTTLMIVGLVTPVKNGLQSVVDKRFKEAPDPTRKLRAFGDQVRSFVQLSSAEELTQRLLDEVTAAFHTTGGAIYLERQGHLHLVHTSGKWAGDAQLSVPLKAGSEQLGTLSLGPRVHGLEYTPQDTQTLQGIVDLVAQAIELAERNSGLGGLSER